MLYVFSVISPGSELDRDEWTIQDPSLDMATLRAHARLHDTFSLASAEQRGVTSLRHIATFASQRDYLRALDEARESGVALTGNDVDAVLSVVLPEDFAADDESTPCISSGCDARIEPGESADADVAVCCDCYGEGRQAR